MVRSSGAWGGISGGQQVPGTIFDSGNPVFNQNSPFSTPFEYVWYTGNNQATDALTVARGKGGTSRQTFYAGATLAAGLLSEVFSTNTGAFVRVDETVQQNLLGPIAVPPAVGVAVATSSYGSMPIKIAEVGPLLSAQANMNFTSIPSGFRSLQLRWALRGSTSADSTGLIVQFNGDSGTNYDQQSVTIIHLTSSPNEQNGTGSPAVGTISAATASANHFGTGTADIENYSSTNMFKSVRAKGGYSVTTGTSQRAIVDTWVLWRNTAALSSMLLLPGAGQFDVGSWAGLYGIP